MTESLAREGEELTCIWVLAGVLSYRLCDRNYECEACALFHALRGGPISGSEEETDGSSEIAAGSAPDTAVEGRVNSCLSRLIAGCKLHLDRSYSPNHFWLSCQQGREVFLGLDRHILKILYPIDEIVTPRVGLRLKQGEPFGWITRGRIAIPMAAPISGEVKAVNGPYLDAVRARGRIEDPQDWLLRLDAFEPLDAIQGLYRGEEILVWYLRNTRVLKRYLREAVYPKADHELGPTLSAGGAPEPDLEDVLGREQFERLIDEIL
ncbi:MAG: hypothetical protein JSV86_19775 [Gemmatimonadota bacterium]|nr:MAG: hypothetical protein JSV86_19775 [Gemmatimonadota bacterium]